jgi:hypothetical protein
VKWLNDESNRLSHNKQSKEKDRIKRGKKDIIVTGGNIANVRGESGDINIDMFIKNITSEPESIFVSNPKSEKSDVGRPQKTVNTGLPAMTGIVYDLNGKHFYSITTCPSAGNCLIGCYARKAFYGMDDSKTMLLTQRLNLLLNNPKRYEEMIYSELVPLAQEMDDASIGMKDKHTLYIRWNDAGDFFGDKYFNIAVNVTKTLLKKKYNVKSYAYTKSSEYVIELDKNKKFVVNFSSDAASSDVEKINNYNTDDNVKISETVPKDVFRKYFQLKGPHYKKNYNELPRFINNDAPNNLKEDILKLYGDKFNITRENLMYTYELPRFDNKRNYRKYNVIVLPTGDSDIGAQREDVKISFLLEH